MDCETCTIVDVCKIAESVREASIHATLTVTNCKIKRRLGEEGAPVAVQEQIVPQAPAPALVPGIRQYRDFSAESKAADDLMKGLEQNVSKVVITEDNEAPISDVEMNCPSCQATTMESDVTVCEKCGKNMICSNCATETGGKRICDPCWNA